MFRITLKSIEILMRGNAKILVVNPFSETIIVFGYRA